LRMDFAHGYALGESDWIRSCMMSLAWNRGQLRIGI
jgi:hypothetical protein